MHPLAAALVLAALAWPGTAAAERWRPDVRGAAEWAAGRTGVISFAVRTRDRLVGRSMDRGYPSASVIKAMLLVTYLRRPDVRARELVRADRRLLAPMVRRSDNLAATRVRDIVGNDAITRLARTAGMTRFTVDPVWGRSTITSRDQTRFFLHIDRLVPEPHRAYAMRLLRSIVPSQRWGMGRVIPKGWRLYFKGGWGDASGAVDHQVGLLRRGRHRVAIAVLTVGNPTHAYGNATLEGVARRLVEGLEPQRRGTARQVRAALG